MTRRDLRIETLRGLACLLLVAYHAVGDDTRGLRLPADSLLRWLSDSFVYLRMPLFTFLSGYVYAIRPAQAGTLVPFFRGKIRRLLLPLVFVGLAYHFIQGHLGGVNIPPTRGLTFLFFSYDHFWYLQALFLIFCIIYVVDTSGLGHKLRRLWILVAVSFVVLPHIRFAADPFSINGAFYLLPYFLLGVAFRRTDRLHDPAQLPRLFTVVSGIAVLAFAVWHQAELAGWIQHYLSPDRLSGQAYSALCISFLYSLAFTSTFLATIGKYSYSIYLFHVFGTAGSRIALTHLGIEQPAALFAGSMLAGLLLPVLLERIFDRYAPTRMLLLGRAWFKSTGPRPPSPATP